MPDREIREPAPFGRTYSGVCAVGQAVGSAVLKAGGEGVGEPRIGPLCGHDRGHADIALPKNHDKTKT